MPNDPMTDHRCPDDPIGAMFHATVVDPDTGEKYDAGMLLDCSPEVGFAWDQWMVCSIRCNHGTFQGVACGVNFTECFGEAVHKFNAYDHDEPTSPREQSEEWQDYRARRNTEWAIVVEFCDAHRRRIHAHGFDYKTMHQDLCYSVDVHDDDGSRCTPVHPAMTWDAEFPAEVSFCAVSDTGKRVNVTTVAHMRVQYWHQYWENNLRLRIQELGR